LLLCELQSLPTNWVIKAPYRGFQQDAKWRKAARGIVDLLALRPPKLSRRGTEHVTEMTR
jgi:hypothetical protein